MKLIALPDLHDTIDSLKAIGERLASVDLVLLVGDLTFARGAAGITRVVETVRQYNKSILAVPGNWEDLGAIAYLTGEGMNLDRRNVVLDGIAFVGVGGSLFSPSRAPNEFVDTDFREFLQEAILGLNEDTPKILVSHQPPAGTLNEVASTGLRLGSEAVREFIQKVQPLACFTGHVHEAQGVDTIGKTKIINPGPLWFGKYAYAEIDRQAMSFEIRGV